MNNPDLESSPETSIPARVSGFISGRPRLPRRRRQARGQARRRIEEHTVRPLTPQQRSRAVPKQRSRTNRVLSAIAAILGSAAAHGLIVGIGVVTAALSFSSKSRDDGPVVIEVQEHEEQKPKDEPPPKEPEREDKPTAVVHEAPKAAAEKVEPQPQEAPKSAPLRVVGISLESTGEGSDGPAFAVGSTRLGETASRATDPNLKAPETAVAPTTKVPTAVVDSGANRAAARIPTAKVPFSMPKMKKKKEPPYPATLRSQGIEADVIIAVSVDQNGKATDVKLISPSPYPEFNEAARKTALSQEFEPAMRDGVPIAYTLSYSYRFRIEEK